MLTSSELFERAKKVIPGGVNSPVRAFLSMHGTPRFIKGGQGSHIFDVEDREYIDYVGSWGPLILGHAHPAVTEAVQKAVTQGLSFGAATADEVEIAELICQMVPSVEMVRMVNSGTEAVMSALRLARGYTGRSKIIKFTGCYHGHSDAMLVKAGSGLMTGGVADSAGVPPSVAADTLLAEYNNLNSVEELFNAYPSAIAAVIVEPVAANMGVVLPEEGFLPGLRHLCDKYQSLLIFDEVITGFRLAPGGAQEFYGILPDLTTLGKIIGGGMPVGAYGGRREIMQQVAPLGPVYQAGTLSGNPVAMAAGLATLRILSDNREIYQTLDELSQIWARGVRRLIKNYQMPVTFNAVGSISSLFFTPQPVKNYRDAKGCDTALYELYFNHMLACGIYLAPSQFEASFVSAAHSRHDVVCALEAFTDFVGIMDWSGQ